MKNFKIGDEVVCRFGNSPHQQANWPKLSQYYNKKALIVKKIKPWSYKIKFHDGYTYDDICDAHLQLLKLIPEYLKQ